MLASLLRECAAIVERNEASPLLFKAVETLNAYAEQRTNQQHAFAQSTPKPHHPGAAGLNGNFKHAKSSNNNDNNKTSNNNGIAGKRPAFQRPINRQSNLIASGWLEQQRRSALRIVWKDVLTSLVEARRPGEETTLWIQREVMKRTTPTGGGETNYNASNSTTLDALHQIPMKWLLSVRYLDDYGDCRICLKVYNVPDEFVFRAPDEDSCKQWVATLSSAKEASQQQYLNRQKQKEAGMGTNANDNTNHNNANASNTNGSSHGSSSSSNQINGRNNVQTSRTPPPPQSKQSSTTSSSPLPSSNNKKKSVNELIAIAHGAGYNTRGMERADLEKIANHFAPASERPPPKQQQQQKPTPHHHPQQQQYASPSSAAAAAAASTKLEEQDRKRKEEEENNRIKHQIENLRIQQEQQRQEQQRKMQQEEELRKERNRKMQQDYDVHRAQQQQQQQQRQSTFDQQFQENSFQQPQPQQQKTPPPPPSSSTRPNMKNSNPPHFATSSRSTDPTSPLNQKYTKQINQDEQQQQQTKETSIINIKRNILISWALIPPQYNMLKPIDQLLMSIQKVFPPFSNVPSHDYFMKWKIITRDELHNKTSSLEWSNNHVPDENKLKKAHRKLRVLLHPDRLPKDLDVKQKFVCKMLWDVSNDAYEEYMKNKDDLDWVNK